MSALAQRLMERLECPVCCEQYDLAARLPRLLHGGHTLCMSCLDRLPGAAASPSPAAAAAAGNSSAPVSVVCPLCNHSVVRPQDGYPVNFTLVDALEVVLLQPLGAEGDAAASATGAWCDQCDTGHSSTHEHDESRATMRCITCNQWLCSLHHTSHTRSKATKHHVLKGVGDIQANPTLYREVPMCSKHPQQPLDLFCLDCDVPICSRCSMLAPHQKHDREETHSAFATFQQQMEPAMEEAERVAVACKEGARDVDQRIADTRAHEEAQTQRARAYFQQLRAALTQREEAICRELHAATSERTKALELQAEALRFDYAYAGTISPRSCPRQDE